MANFCNGISIVGCTEDLEKYLSPTVKNTIHFFSPFFVGFYTFFGCNRHSDLYQRGGIVFNPYSPHPALLPLFSHHSARFVPESGRPRSSARSFASGFFPFANSVFQSAAHRV